MKIAHLSDIHFFRNHLSLSTLFSKRLLGTLNHFFKRKRAHLKFDPFQVPDFLKEKGVTHVVISGDFTTTSNENEYRAASNFLKRFKDQGLKVFCVPGNHDMYTRGAEKSRRFYRYIETPAKLEESGLSLEDFGGGYQCIRLDTTLATPYWSSEGSFTPELEKRLRNLLDSIPRDQPLIVINHFPVFAGKRPKRHQMKRYEALRELLEAYPNIVLYLYGHTHKSEFVVDSPIMINCGSLTLTREGSFHIMDLSDDFLEVEAYHCNGGEWKVRLKRSFAIRTLVKDT